MEKVIKNVTASVTNKNNFEAIIAKQNDQASRFLKITLTNSNEMIRVKSSTARAMVNFCRSDGQTKSFACEINADGTITAPLTKWALEVADQLNCSISIYDESSKLTSTSFRIDVEKTESVGEDISNDDSYDILLQLITECDEATEKATAATTAANTAAESANTAAQAAVQAAAAANTAASLANSKAQAAETAAQSANAAAQAASQATAAANTAAGQANSKAQAAETAAATATEAAAGINDVASAATAAAAAANTAVDDLKAYLGYTDDDIVGLQVDYKNKQFTRLAGAVGKTAGTDFDDFSMFGGRKRCNVSDDGTISAYYGDAGYNEDGSSGQVMVYQPKFYYRIVPLEYDKNTTTGIGYHLRKANYYVSPIPKTGFKLHPAFYDVNGNAVDYILLSAYEGSMYDVSGTVYVNDGVDTDTAIETGDLLCSVAGKKPISGLKKALTKANLELMAQNRGANWHLENIKAASANQLLMIIELGTMNTQTAIGQGVVSISDNTAYNCASLTGSTASIGNGTGQATETTNEIGGTETAYTASGKLAVTYRGVENPWGNIWKHIQGINIWGNGSMGGGQPYVAEGFTYNESKNTDPYHPVGFTLANASGYVNAMGYGSEEYDWLFMPSEIGGSSALPVGDYFYVTPNLNGYRIALLGGYWSYGGSAGSFCWHCSYGVGIRYRAFSGRLVYVPTKDSTAYLAAITSWNEKMAA